MARVSWISVLLLLIAQNALAQSTSTLIGARAAGMGYTSSCLADEWSMFNNIGGLSSVKNVQVAFTVDAWPSMPSFNRIAAIIASPIKHGVAGVGIFRFGDDLYSEHMISGGFSNRFGIASLGIKVNYIQYRAEGFGNKSVLTLSFGGIATLTEKLSVGAHIINVNQPHISTFTEEETIPTILIAGFAFRASEKILISSELQKDIAYPAVWKAGLEYTLNPKLLFRTGFNLNPDTGFLGIGFKPKKFTLDYSFKYDLNTGSTHQATAGYKFSIK